ncbi:acetoacetate-CoA ligase [Cladophialophora carrionii CBS 160.54]|uniref:Acetoacetate-CoA ligase n=1 Tax=Cladophialophora carrionii CBS 160.54 TaxID=1279043 RepID=V9DJ95_9EURO|nr:acetoacetate-CoA ligase [Cladophialophora carrionii CBS 160.54]ETI26012.1 acetoacetate-CoA ligase [Cladophialophora carrionii CBS 160.54]
MSTTSTTPSPASLSKSASMSQPELLWTPSDPESTLISQYRHRINHKFSQSLKDSHDLHTWTVRNPHEFWIDLYDYCGIIPPLPKHTKLAYNPNLRLRDVPTFFPGLRLNYAENVLVPNTQRDPHAIALVGLRENGLSNPENITWAELTELVRLTRSAMVRQGIQQGDVIAALMANSIWIIVLFLASASIGAVFTSVSPDLGVPGCVSRFSQVEPKWLFTDTDLALRGTRPSMMGKVLQILRSLPRDKPKPKVVFVPTCHKPHLKTNLQYVRPVNDAISLATFLEASRPADKLTYTRMPTDQPLVIVYSSGTTGEPKCIVSPHISILNYKKISLLHNGLTPQSTVFQYSSTSWILWNVMNGHLSVGAKVICYDGGALYPDPSTMLRIIERFRATYWGTSPRYLLELEQSGILDPSSPTYQKLDLSSLTLVTCTGATLTTEQFTWFYHPVRGISPTRKIHLSSVAGGTDIASSWIATNPAGPVYANEMQLWALGHDCDILDSETGESIAHTGMPGELVCRKPFPSMPCRFWGDTGNKKYMEAYFEKFPISRDGNAESKTVSKKWSWLPGKANDKADALEYLDVWAQHDFITRNPKTGGLQILGRSDGVLNPSGIRFGSSEIYNIVEGPQFNTLISDTLCVGRRRSHDKDETVFLFVIMAPGHENDFTPALVDRIKSAIREGLSPRHVPKFVFQVKDIPYTVNGKKVEIAVKKVISGANVKVSSTVRNPASLQEYERFRDIEREAGSSRRGRDAKL